MSLPIYSIAIAVAIAIAGGGGGGIDWGRDTPKRLYKAPTD